MLKSTSLDRQFASSAKIRRLGIENVDALETLGIGKRQLPQLASKIQGLLREKGWKLDAKLLKTTMQPGVRVGELTRTVAKHMLLRAPKTCANGPSTKLSGANGVRFGRPAI